MKPATPIHVADHRVSRVNHKLIGAVLIAKVLKDLGVHIYAVRRQFEPDRPATYSYMFQNRNRQTGHWSNPFADFIGVVAAAMRDVS